MEFLAASSLNEIMDNYQSYTNNSHGAIILGNRPTGYPEEFRAALEKSIAESRQDGLCTALVLVSIENLSMIMSGYGHKISEEVMQALMNSVVSFLADKDIMARLQKDQFSIILQSTTPEEITYVTERINGAIQQFGYHSEYGSLHVLPSVVCIELSGERANAEEALDQAYIALRHNRGMVHQSFDENQLESANSRQEMGLANYLSKAIKEERLRLAYQPIIESKTGNISHYEALLRIVSHDGKISSAGALIPIAERMGLINIIDELVLDMVVREVRQVPDITLAFNVSNLTTSNKQWLSYLKKLIAETPDIAERLIIEITETAVHRDLRKTAYFVAAVQSMGIQVALDDFGSGYTSFRQLKSLSVDMVKIDGVFVRDLVDNHDNRLFVKTMLDFTNGFGLKAVAEFVENGEIAKMLIDLGVEYMQGYYFGRPENHRRWLDD
jgi:diguanylate cyclase (GGDEF)-like protein